MIWWVSEHDRKDSKVRTITVINIESILGSVVMTRHEMKTIRRREIGTLYQVVVI